MMRGFVDLMVAFGEGAPAVTRRENGEWELLSAFGEARLYKESEPDGLPLLSSAQSGGWTLYGIGELFQYKGRSGTSPQLLQSFADDLENGTDQAATLNGRFIIIGARAGLPELSAWTDRLGTIHLYHSGGSSPSLGTFYPAVAARSSRRSLDWTGLASFFQLGFFSGTRTHYEDVQIIPPATHVQLHGDGRIKSAKRYWNWSHQPRAEEFDRSVEEFGEILHEVVHDQTATGRLVLPISSGLDSRTIAGSMTGKLDRGAAHRTWAYSYGYSEHSVETSTAAKVARARNLSFEKFVIADYLPSNLQNVNASVEGFQGVANTRQAAMSSTTAAHGDYLLAAHWGDVWMDDAGLSALTGMLDDDQLVDHAIARMSKPGGAALVRNAVSDSSADAAAKGLRDDMHNQLANSLDVGEADFRVKALKTDQWSFRWTVASLRMFQRAAFPRLPFYDNRLVDCFCTLPAAFVKGRRLQIEYLKRFHPDLARINWDVTDSSLYFSSYYNSLLLPKRIYRKAWRMLSRAHSPTRNWEVQFLGASGRAMLNEHLLASHLKIRDVVSGAYLHSVVQEMFAKPDRENGYAVNQLLTLAVWLEKYG